MQRLVSLVALAAILTLSGWAQSSPAIAQLSGFDAPPAGRCADAANVGSTYDRLGNPSNGFVGRYFCQQTGASSLGTGSYGWVAVVQQPTTPTTGTLSVANGKAAVVSNSLTLAGTDSTTMTFPTTSATVARTDAANTFTGHQTIEGVTSTGATGTGNFVFATTPTLSTPILTTPTVTNPVINGPAPVACGATCSVATTQAGIVFLLNQAGGSAATLPASSGSGNIYKFRITVATTSAQDKILLTTTSDVIIGTATGENAGTAKVFVGNAGTFHSIQMPFAGSQPSGGFIGDSITCTDIAAGTYACDVTYQAGTTPTTPYSTSTT